MDIGTVGVIGAGVMGVGVAQNLAQTGHRVILVDLTDAILEQAKAEIRKNVRLHLMFNRGKSRESADDILQRITFTRDYRLFTDVDFVIENATEKWEIKKSIYEQIDAICPEYVIFAVNTSAISITRIGSLTRFPARVIGTHFMNPVPMKTTVEVIRGYHTSEQTIETTKSLLASMGKDCVVVNDMPGFVSNRVLMLTVNEAVYLVQDQVASAEEVDHIFKSCFGHPMGPLETADLIGLDTILYSVEVLYESYNDSKYRPCPLLKKMVDAGLYGRKNGQGFYT
ncbi:MAG TPA: 3-hydroxyacyl-CoA dehydrogenase NAD-binding domain-containing protein, partial [Ktedonobacteraceae bacterium]|nr:3-hydroxyacyl-CoA dehydrogenase NAD-binding domain-containing protein [Ktedonobacteraceae bacterium]